MGEICIKYSDLEDSISKAKKLRGEIDGYISDIKKYITTPNSKLSGSDSMEYVSTASSLAQQKITSLSDLSTRFSNYETSLSAFVSDTKSTDKKVESEINKIADACIEKRTWYQKTGDWIYNTFCVDLANSNGLFRTISDAAKWCVDKGGNVLGKVKDWFKYGDGKYVWNIATSVIATVVAVGGAVAAVCAIPFTGGATIPIVIGCIGAAAASIGAFITVANSKTTIKSNTKAIKLSGNLLDDDDGNPGVARYYGNVSKLSEYWAKTDLGDAKTNMKFESLGKGIDRTKVVADVTALVCSVASLGNVRDLRITTVGKSNINTRYNKGKWYKGYSFTPKNIIKNIKADMGIKVSKNVKNGRIKEGAFKTNIFEKGYTVEKKFTLRWVDKAGNIKSWSAPEKLVKIFRDTKVTKNLLDNEEYLSNIHGYLSNLNHKEGDTWKVITSLTGLGGSTKFLKPLNDYLAKTGNNFNSVYKLIKE